MLRKGIVILLSAFTLGAFTNQSAAQGKKLKTIVVDAGHGGKDSGAQGDYENSLGSKEKDVTLAISKKLVAELKKRLPDINVVPTRTTDVFDDVHEKARKANEVKGDLFLCIHADSGGEKRGSRQTGIKMVTRYRVTYTGKGRKKKKHTETYEEEVPVYEYFKNPCPVSGTSVWIFAAAKTKGKLDAIMEEGDNNDNTEDSAYNNFNFNSPEGRQLAQVYAKAYQEKSDLMATLVNDEVELTGRKALGVKQRQKGIWVLSATRMPAILIETGFINNDVDERYINSEKGQQELAEAITKAVIKYRVQIEKK
jgi:N-acetylmuramoyl-L-alanine amidase